MLFLGPYGGAGAANDFHECSTRPVKFMCRTQEASVKKCSNRSSRPGTQKIFHICKVIREMSMLRLAVLLAFRHARTRPLASVQQVVRMKIAASLSRQQPARSGLHSTISRFTTNSTWSYDVADFPAPLLPAPIPGHRHRHPVFRCVCVIPRQYPHV